MSGKKGMTHYEQSIKQEAVRLFIDDGYTYKQIAEKLEIRVKGQIKTWVRHFRQDGSLTLRKSPGRPKKILDEKAYISKLEMENKILKKLQSELREVMLAKRDIGQSAIIKKNLK